MDYVYLTNGSIQMINNYYQRIKNNILKLPLITWVLLGFFITFFFFFVVPIFFDPSQSMKINQDILALTPIGFDFGAVVATSSTWIHSGEFVPIVYPAFTLIFYAPFTLLSFETGYKLLIVLILVCYVLTTLLLPQVMNGSKGLSALAMLVFVSGMVSYGFQFELERGQSNVLAFAFCLIAIYIFHLHPRRRWLAYLFFTVAVQLKLFPVIFIFAFIDDWSAWRINIKRIVGLGILNVLSLFVLGVSPVLNTIGSIGQSEGAHVGRPFNLSISSFVLNLLSLHSLPHKRIILWLQANSWLPQLFLFAFFAVCFLIILRQAYKNNSKGLNPSVFLACTIGACIIPALSFDYKLSLLPAAVMFIIPVLRSFERDRNRFSIVILTFLFATAYSSTLYSYANKPAWLQYNLPALLVILTICTMMSCVRPGEMMGTSSNSTEVNSEGLCSA